MSNRRIHIEKLRIRLPHNRREQASAVGRSIAHEVVSQIAAVSSGRTGSIRIGEISAGRVENAGRAGELAAKKVGGVLNQRNRK